VSNSWGDSCGITHSAGFGDAFVSAPTGALYTVPLLPALRRMLISALVQSNPAGTETLRALKTLLSRFCPPGRVSLLFAVAEIGNCMIDAEFAAAS
jgi:hypothetical protein